MGHTMPRRPRGFDPLASLFDSPNSDNGLDEIPIEVPASAATPAFPLVIELTDPFFSAPEEGPIGPARRILGPEGRAAMNQHLAAGDPDLAIPDEIPAPIRPASNSGPGLPVSTGAPPPELFEEPPPDPPLPPPLPEPSEPDPIVLARALARAAVAKAGPPTPSRVRPDSVEEPPAPPPPTTPPPTPPSIPRVEQPPKPMSRVEALSQRAVRPRSAQDVIQRAQQVTAAAERRAEAKRREVEQAQAERPGTPRPPIVHKVQRLLERKLRGLGPITVNNCIVLDDREVLRALWRAHRARFGAEGKLDQVVGTAAVLDAFERVPEAMLVAAHVLTEASDYLVWLDMREGTPLAAFADARAYFVGQQTGA